MDEHEGPADPGRRRLLRNVALAAGGLGVVAAGFLAGRLMDRSERSRAAALAGEVPGFLWPDPPALPEFELVDHRGAPFTRERLEGRWSLFYFGYTYCPDACPVALAALAGIERALREAPELLAALQLVFVSVDPARDRAVLGDYVAHFSPRMVGATGDDKALTALTRPMGIVYRRAEPDADGQYLVDHSTSLLLVDPEGRLVGVFGTPHDPADLAARIRRIRELIG